MTRKNQQQIHNEQKKTELTRARAARDVALRSIKKILSIAKDAIINSENRPTLEARVMSLGQLVTDFNNEQKHILSTLAETDEVDQFVEVDENVTETMQSMCDQINVIVAKLKQNTSMPTPRNDRSQSSVQSLILPRIGFLSLMVILLNGVLSVICLHLWCMTTNITKILSVSITYCFTY